jgi:ATP-dependent DNA helicase RecG
MISKEFLDTEITYLQGVGPKRAELLNKELSIFTFRDLLYYFPYKYIDRTRFYKIAELDPDLPFVQIKGFIRGYSTEGQGPGKRLVAEFHDNTGTIKLVWFKGGKWITGNYSPGIEYIVLLILYTPKLKLLTRWLKGCIPRCRRNTALRKNLKINLLHQKL